METDQAESVGRGQSGSGLNRKYSGDERPGLNESGLDQQAIAGLVAVHPEISLIYLFGSRARNEAVESSDYDFAVLIDRDADTPAYRFALRSELHHALVCLLDTDKVDLLLLGQAPVELAYGVILEGRLLYERDVATRVEYQAQVAGLYCDYLPILREQRRRILSLEEALETDEARVRWYRAALIRAERAFDEARAALAEDGR